MMYSQKFVAAIKVEGAVLREISSHETPIVSLPFGCEYSVFLKNLNSVRALAQVSVDGQDATDGNWLILPANGSMDLERFIRNGNQECGNRFKFIERSAAIEKHRGVGAEDGLIRIEFKVEHVQAFVDIPRPRYYDVPTPRPCPPWDRGRRWNDNSPIRRTHVIGAKRSMGPSAKSGSPMRKAMNPTRSAPMASVSAMNCSMPMMDSALNDAGITVAGSESNQRFVTGAWFPTEAQSHVIVLRLRGEVAGKPIVRPVTVAHKPQCSTCGTVNKAAHQFCSTCGTAMVLI